MDQGMEIRGLNEALKTWTHIKNEEIKLRTSKLDKKLVNGKERDVDRYKQSWRSGILYPRLMVAEVP